MPTRGHQQPVTRHSLPNASNPLYVPPRNGQAPGCKAPEELIFDPSLMILSIMYLVFGFVYTFFGYRFFKANTFVTGFTFGTLIIYLICLQDYLLPHIGNIIVAVFGGVLFGSITMLIQYVGLFINGLHTGLLLSMVGLAVYDHMLTEYPTTYWFCIVTMTCCGIFFAIINLYWKKGMTLFGTALYGGALFTLSVDYYYERAELLKWLWERAKLEAVTPLPCRLSWLFLAMWPFLTFVGFIAQLCLTGIGIHHEESITAQKRRLQRQQARPITREQRAELRQKKYRYLYQVRTAHGDVISQSYVQALQKKAQMNNWNSNAVAGECSTLQSDSTHLTVLPGSDHHHESDEDINQIRTVH